MLDYKVDPVSRRVLKLSGTHAEYLSDSNIVAVLIDLDEAKKNLSDKEYDRVVERRDYYSNQKQEELMNLSRYYERSFCLLNDFSKIAPFEKYCGNPRKEAEYYRANVSIFDNFVKKVSTQYMDVIRPLADEEASKYAETWSGAVALFKVATGAIKHYLSSSELISYGLSYSSSSLRFKVKEIVAQKEPNYPFEAMVQEQTLSLEKSVREFVPTFAAAERFLDDMVIAYFIMLGYIPKKHKDNLQSVMHGWLQF